MIGWYQKCPGNVNISQRKYILFIDVGISQYSPQRHYKRYINDTQRNCMLGSILPKRCWAFTFSNCIVYWQYTVSIERIYFSFLCLLFTCHTATTDMHRNIKQRKGTLGNLPWAMRVHYFYFCVAFPTSNAEQFRPILPEPLCIYTLYLRSKRQYRTVMQSWR